MNLSKEIYPNITVKAAKGAVSADPAKSDPAQAPKTLTVALIAAASPAN